MKHLLFLLVCIYSCKIILAQQAETSNTYAIIIGVAKYLDPDIPQLQFSNRDAAAFADYLMSASGGSVPKQQIRLLTDSAATIGEVDKALRWVLNNCKENDRVYFYFSGHGEMENFTMSKNGYLICYNTPSVAFVNMGLSIDYLNDVVNTLSVQSKAKVVLITDACHSGTVAGSKFKGNFFVGEQLMLKKQNEIRMASSKPDQLSNEKSDWGGGRGVFSYYLLNGLQGGLADTDNDKQVNVGELKNYLENKMANDPVLKNEGDVQTPVINGDAGFKLAKVVEAEAVKVKQQAKNDSVTIMMVMSAMAPVNEDEDTEPDSYFFNSLKKQSLEVLTDSLALNKLNTNDIAFELINRLKKIPTSETGLRKLAALETSLKNDQEKLSRFNVDLAGSFIDIGQAVIANYINGDEAELERRRYYNSKNNNYDVYVRMFEVAFKLSQSDKYYSTKAEVFLHYFSGLALRLKIPLTENPAPLIEQALDHQKKALALEEFAAYIYNELGILYQFKKNYAEAEKFFIKATELSPQWAIPQSNLSSLYIGKKDYQKALRYLDKADSLQSNLQTISINRGFINERKGNQLFAEEDYRYAIEINSRHFLPFERLGYVYMNTASYAMADSFFYEADLRKKGFHFKGNEWELEPTSEAYVPTLPLSCDVDTAILDPADVFAFFTWGVQEYWKSNYPNAIRILRKVVAINKTNPLVYHYLGKVYYDQQKWEEAELMFKLAAENSKGLQQFNSYVDSVVNSKKYQYEHECFENFFRRTYYRQVEDYYFSGTLYERWKHFEEAEKYFRQIINLICNQEYIDAKVDITIAPGSIELFALEQTPAYVKLWQLLEKQGRYAETEEVIEKFVKQSKKQADEELNEFYRRMIDRFPENGDWAYRLGNLLYTYAPQTARLPYMDSIAFFPLMNKELFIDSSIYMALNTNDSLALYDLSETGAIRLIKLNKFDIRLKRDSYKVPGTGEYILCADAIYMPRKDGITYLQRAAELIAEKETLADIHFKTGNIYLWAGSKKQSWSYFEKSLSLVPDNANARLTLVDIYKALYKNRAAFKQLNYLSDSNQINQPKRILFAQFNIWAGNFNKAHESLNKTENYTPYFLPEINNLRGLAAMLADKPKQAIEDYFKSLYAQHTDTIWYNSYSLARLYAKTGNNSEAWKYLQYAVNAGFNFGYVLQKDSYMESLRKTEKWKTLMSGIAMKKYKKDKPFN